MPDFGIVSGLKSFAEYTGLKSAAAKSSAAEAVSKTHIDASKLSSDSLKTGEPVVPPKPHIEEPEGVTIGKSHEDEKSELIGDEVAALKASKPEDEKKALAEFFGTKSPGERAAMRESLNVELSSLTSEKTRVESELSAFESDPNLSEHGRKLLAQKEFARSAIQAVEEKLVVLKPIVEKDTAKADGWMKRSASSGTFQWVTAVAGLATGAVFLPQAFQSFRTPKSPSQDAPDDAASAQPGASATPDPGPSDPQQNTMQRNVPAAPPPVMAPAPPPNPYAGLYSPVTAQPL